MVKNQGISSNLFLVSRVFTLLCLFFISCEKLPIDWNLPKAPEITKPNVLAYDLTTIDLIADCIDDGNDPDVIKGFCWSNAPYPTIDSYKYESPERGSGTVSASIYWPTNQLLYIRSYAINQTTVFYSDPITVVWPGGLQNLPSVNTLSVQNIDFTNATVSGQVVSDGGLPIIESGIWLTDSLSNPVQFSNQNGDGLFSLSIDNLIENKRYHVRAYATNLAGTSYGPILSFTTRNYFSIGELGPGGGVVFYAKNDTLGGWQFLEAAQADLPGTFNWSGTIVSATNINACSIGSGLVNTNAIVGQIGQSSTYAARACYDFSSGGLFDWFLPSRDELLMMRNNLGLNLASIYGLSNAYYWSSSEDSNFTGQNSWAVHMQSSANYVISLPKPSIFKVRPIRRFK